MADLRKIQRTPGGTFFVCLPKAWADKNGLKRGVVVSVSETSEGSLLVDPHYGAELAPRTVTLRPGPYLSREIIGKYLLGFDVIRVEVKNRISFEVRDTVKKTVGKLIGLEIVEEDHSSIVLQCLVEPSGWVPERILRRGYAIVAGMHRDSISAFLDGDAQLAKNVVARDDESNRLYFLLVRVLRTIIQTPSLGEKLGVSTIECIDYRLVASLVEGIGDESVRISMKTVDLKNKKIDKELKKLFMKLHSACFQAHEEALNAFLAGDISLAEKVREIRKDIDGTFSEIEKVARQQSLDVVPPILSVASFLRQIYEHSIDIADLVVPKRVVP
jgi:phosphate uptake regulator